jgi:DNA-binding CsgD family transcriptional regulator
MLAESLGAASCVIRTDDTSHPFRVDQRTRTAKTPDSTGHMEFSALWLEKIDGAPDPLIESHRWPSKQGVSFVVEEEITTAEERARLPYYHEIARPGRREWRASVGFTVKNRGWCLPFFRDAKRGPFEPHEADVFLKIVPHFRRIISSAEQMADIQASNSLNVLDQVGYAAALLDDRGCVKRLNNQADALLGPHLLIRHGRIRAADRASDSRLQGLVSAAASGLSRWSTEVESIVIARSGSPWLLVETLPLTSFGHDIFATGRTLLRFTELCATRPPGERRLQSAFSLTAAEARLATHLADGSGIDLASERLGISRETARTQLRAIFAKTGTRGQPQLTSLMAQLRSPAEH